MPYVLNKWENQNSRFNELYGLGSITNTARGPGGDPTGGAVIDITSLTYRKRKLVVQKYYEVAVAEYMNVEVGAPGSLNAYASEIVQQSAQIKAGLFGQAVSSPTHGGHRPAQIQVKVGSHGAPILEFTAAYGVSRTELQQATLSSDWHLIEAKIKGIMEAWHLGIQEVSFLGFPDEPKIVGLLNIPGVTINTTSITEPISDLTIDEFRSLIGNLIKAFRSNSDFTAWPNRLVIPDTDYATLITPWSNLDSTPKLDVFEKAFQSAIKHQKGAKAMGEFKILPCAYAEEDRNPFTSAENRYALYHKDPETLNMNIPMDLLMLPEHSEDGLYFHGSSIGRFRALSLPV